MLRSSFFSSLAARRESGLHQAVVDTNLDEDREIPAGGLTTLRPDQVCQHKCSQLCRRLVRKLRIRLRSRLCNHPCSSSKESILKHETCAAACTMAFHAAYCANICVASSSTAASCAETLKAFRTACIYASCYNCNSQPALRYRPPGLKSFQSSAWRFVTAGPASDLLCRHRKFVSLGV